MVGNLEYIAPHVLGVFMIALACIPLVFVWQDRGRKLVEQKRVGKLRREARIAAELRARGMVEAEPNFADGWIGGEARR
ncbi:MAG: hypothetical protein JWR10_1981 [Rubritepida sp.]|nr:hypothetical protein [Rubritepida sp.]